MKKHERTAFLGYCAVLLMMVITSMRLEINVVNVVYLVIVLCSSLKFILIFNEDKK